MMAKRIKALELHYPMIQILIILIACVADSLNPQYRPHRVLYLAWSRGPIIMRGRCVSGHVVRESFFSPGRSSRIRHRNALTERAWKDAVQGLGNALSRSRGTISAGKQDNYPIDFMNINTCKDTANWKVRRGCYVLSCYISRVKTLLHFGSLELLHFWSILRFASKVFLCYILQRKRNVLFSATEMKYFRDVFEAV